MDFLVDILKALILSLSIVVLGGVFLILPPLITWKYKHIAGICVMSYAIFEIAYVLH